MRQILAFSIASLALASCASLGSYSYKVHSQPVYSKGNLSDQIEVTSLAQTSALSNVCHLKTTRRNYKTLWLGETVSHGSGALLENRYLVTAAHNVFDYPANKLTSLAVTCGKTVITDADPSIFLSRNQIKSAVSVPRYEYRIRNSGKQYEFDYAFVDLGKKVSDKSLFRLGQVEDRDREKTIYLGGFPGGVIANGDQLYVGTGTIVDLDANLLSYSLKTAGGNSGGPVWVENGGSHKIIAIHVLNSGGRVVDEILLSDWIQWKNSREATQG